MSCSHNIVGNAIVAYYRTCDHFGIEVDKHLIEYVEETEDILLLTEHIEDVLDSREKQRGFHG